MTSQTAGTGGLPLPHRHGRRSRETPGAHRDVEPRERFTGHDWWATLKRTVEEFQEDHLTYWAAALTYYGLLSIFPGILVLLSILGLLGQSQTRAVIESITTLAPGQAGEVLTDGVTTLQASSSAASVLAVVGLLVALWSASGYVAVFMHVANIVYDVPEGRPFWKAAWVRVAVTVVTGLVMAIIVPTVFVTGAIAEEVGGWIGLGSTAVTVWDIAKWPVLVILVSLVFSLLYWASPNIRRGRRQWVTIGGVVAVLVWLLASAGFAFYVANFGSYNKIYGTLGGFIIFLVWLWISNLAVLLGAELDAEVLRRHAIAAGHPADEEPFVPLRDTRKLDKARAHGSD